MAPKPVSQESRFRLRWIALAICCFGGLVWALYPQPIPNKPSLDREAWKACNPESHDSVKRVAIIGAGSGGASTAYYINKFKDPCIRVNITVYERSDYVGGRSTTVDAYDDPTEPVELGASIFVKANTNLMSAVEDLGLTVIPHGVSEPDDSTAQVLGVWNGSEFVFEQSDANFDWWNVAKLLWKYGMSPIRTQNLGKKTVGAFVKMYGEPHFPFASLTKVVEDVGLTAVTSVTGEKYLRENKIEAPFSTDIIQASTRVSYAQNLREIHGLETMVCMATDGAMAVKGGNWQIFDGMLKRAGANVLLEISVTDISLQQDETYAVKAISLASDSPSNINPEIYDTIILASPLQFSNITLTPKPAQSPPAIDYVTLHVTLFTSPHLLSPLAFNLLPSAKVPTMILTTTSPTSPKHDLPFFSISTLRSLTNPTTSKKEYLYKIFSPAPLPPSFLPHLLGLSPDTPVSSEKDITWQYLKTWQSYPYLHPRAVFDEIQLDKEGRMWYTSAIEPFISTMETSSLMGMNVARLIVDGWGRTANEGAVEDVEEKDGPLDMKTGDGEVSDL